ncbi:carboxypeptidase-like regulatory domain-containing protein [Nitrospira sp. Ecomares 2.1]
MRVLLPVLAIFLILGVGPSWAYQEIHVSNGGAISGTVTIEGGKPRPMAFNLVTIPDPVYCGRISTGTGWRLVEDFVIGPDAALKDVVVVLKEVSKGKPFKDVSTRIEAIDCDFFPFVNVVRDQSEITVVNMDPIEHDIQGYETARTRGARVLFNRPLPMNPFHKAAGFLGHQHLAGEPMVESIHLRKGRNVFVMQCGFHPYMFSWGLVVDNPYYGITGGDGKFAIGDIPPGEYTLSAWHPGANTFIDQSVTVLANQSVSVQLVFEAPQGRRSVHEMAENPRFGLELLGEEEIHPSLRVQIP